MLVTSVTSSLLTSTLTARRNNAHMEEQLRLFNHRPAQLGLQLIVFVKLMLEILRQGFQ